MTKGISKIVTLSKGSEVEGDQLDFYLLAGYFKVIGAGARGLDCLFWWTKGKNSYSRGVSLRRSGRMGGCRPVHLLENLENLW